MARIHSVSEMIKTSFFCKTYFRYFNKYLSFSIRNLDKNGINVTSLNKFINYFEKIYQDFLSKLVLFLFEN